MACSGAYAGMGSASLCSRATSQCGLAHSVQNWSHCNLDPIGFAVFAIVQNRLLARAMFVHRAAHPCRCCAIGFLALQNRAESFPVQFLERIPTHFDEGGIDPLHEAVRGRKPPNLLR